MNKSEIFKQRFQGAWNSSKWLATLLLTALMGAYLGYAVPKWVADKKIIQVERGFSNKTLPQKLRYKADGTRFPFFYATILRLENVGNVDLSNEKIEVVLADSSMDCGVIKRSDHRIKAYGLRGDKTFDSDFDNFIFAKNQDEATIYLSDLKIGEHRDFLIFSNFAFRTALLPADSELKVKMRTPSRPDASFEDDPWKLTNCKQILEMPTEVQENGSQVHAGGNNG